MPFVWRKGKASTAAHDLLSYREILAVIVQIRNEPTTVPPPDSFLDDKVGAANCHDTMICLSVESHLFDEVVPDLGLGGAIAG